MITNCPVCGKLTCIHWPEHWIYRRGSTYYCGEQCMSTDQFRDMQLLNEVNRRKRKEIIMTKITLEQKKKAVEIAINGGNPLEFLKKCGSGAPDKTWWAIKAALKVKDPDLYAKIPDMRKKTEPAATVNVDGPIRIETKEPEKIEVIEPENPTRIIRKMFGFEVSAIRDDVMGEFYYDVKFNRIDWRSPDGTEVSLSPTAWKSFSEKIPAVLNALGVKL